MDKFDRIYQLHRILAARRTIETILEGYAWLEREDVLACLLYARRIVANERIELLPVQPAA